MDKDNKMGRAGIAMSMVIFGSIGILVRNIDLHSGQIALARAFWGSLPLLAVVIWRNASRKKPVQPILRQNLVRLIISGAAIGFNWIFIFEAYRYTSIAVATLSYYFAPLFVVVLSPIVLKEKLSPAKAMLVLTALAGLFLILLSEGMFIRDVSDAASLTGTGKSLYAGIGFGLLAALLYAFVILMNKKTIGLPGLDMTAVQLVTAFVFLIPYVYFNEGFQNFLSMDSTSWILILTLGILHTGFAYFLYFTSFRHVKGQTIAILSYIDPVCAIIFAAIFLKEIPGPLQIIGGTLILGSTLLSELPIKKAI